MPIEWRDQLTIGVKAIDDDHKNLIGIINEFEEVMLTYVDAPRLNAIAKKLYEYAKTHFEREEKIQVFSDYPEYEAHKAQHAKLLNDLQGFIRKVFIDRSVEIGPATGAELSDFLQHWLVDHVVQCDTRMKGKLKLPAKK